MEATGTKSLRVEVKDAEAGTVEAVFATFNVKDSDWDVTMPGAFENGAAALISAYGHKSWAGLLPVGKGTITATDTEAVFTGQFFMDTIGGQDTFKTVKATGELQEWSYGYDPVRYSYGEHAGERVRFLEQIKVHEVSPVMLGAGVGTRTLSAKGAIRFSDECTAVLAAVKSLSARAADVMAKRQEKGKLLGSESADLLGQLQEQLKALDGVLQAEPEPGDAKAAGQEFLRFVQISTRS